MNYREADIKRKLSNLKLIVEEEVKLISSDEKVIVDRSKLVKVYQALVKAIEKVEEAYQKTGPDQRCWYEFITVNDVGALLFEDKHGELVDVQDALALLRVTGINEQILRNILHVTDFLKAIKVKTTRVHGKMMISKKSVQDFKKLVIEKPAILQGVRGAFIRKSDVPVKRVTTSDAEMQEELIPYALPLY